MEPPGPDVPAPAGSLAALGAVRLTAAAGAATLALTSTGDMVLLAGLLVVAVARPVAAAAVALAAVAVTVRWGTASLAAVAGAQSVLGIAGRVGTSAAGASAWLAAAALVLVTPAAARRPWPGPGGALLVLATGASAAAVVAGPSAADGLLVRLLGLTGALVAAWLAGMVPQPRIRHAVAAAAGAAAVVLAPG